MVTTLQPKTPHTIKLEFSDEPVTSFGGLVLAEKAAARLGLWSTIAGLLPARPRKPPPGACSSPWAN